MKIAMILRPDADRVYGGDSAVMQKMGAVMCDLGAEVVVARQVDIGPADGFDLLHLMGMAPPEHVLNMVGWAKSGDVALLCSPLYFCDFRDWYERASVSVPRWRKLVRLLGKERTWPLYRMFQSIRRTRTQAWRVNRSTLLAADAVATTSRWENAWLADYFRLPPAVHGAMRVAPFGIDVALYGQTFTPRQLSDFRARYGLPEGYVVQVARIEEKKNQLSVIRALYDDPIPLVFVGNRSPYFAPDYADRCYALGKARGNTHFLGWVPEAELPLLYAASAAHILPSWNELPGLASLEAGACGTRVISTEVSALPELFGDMAWYCDPYDTSSIRSAVLAALRSDVPAGLRPRLLQDYSWHEAARVNLAVYQDVITAHRGSRSGNLSASR